MKKFACASDPIASMSFNHNCSLYLHPTTSNQQKSNTSFHTQKQLHQGSIRTPLGYSKLVQTKYQDYYHYQLTYHLKKRSFSITFKRGTSCSCLQVRLWKGNQQLQLSISLIRVVKNVVVAFDDRIQIFLKENTILNFNQFTFSCMEINKNQYHSFQMSLLSTAALSNSNFILTNPLTLFTYSWKYLSRTNFSKGVNNQTIPRKLVPCVAANNNITTLWHNSVPGGNMNQSQFKYHYCFLHIFCLHFHSLWFIALLTAHCLFLGANGLQPLQVPTQHNKEIKDCHVNATTTLSAMEREECMFHQRYQT